MATVGNSLNAASQGIAAQYSQLSQVVLGHNSVYGPKGGQALTPTARDDTTYLAPANGVQTPAWVDGNKIIYNLPKTATLIGKMWHEITLSAGQTNVPYTVPRPANPVAQTAAVAAVNTPTAEYIKNVGDLIYRYIILRYGSTPLQQYTTEMVVAQRMLEKNNINIQDVNTEVLGNLAPGGNSEATLQDAFYTGVTLRHPLDEIWFTQQQDRHWMPEALALEGQLELTLRNPANLIITYAGTGAALTGGSALMPTITNCVLRYQQITLSAAEKMNRLAIYKSPEGLVNLFEDTEDQLGALYVVTGTLTASQLISINVPLSNFRMDSKEIIFYVRVAANTADYTTFSGSLAQYRGSMMESDRTTPASIFTLNGGSNVIGTLLPIVDYKLVAAGKDLYNFQPELLNRTYQRKQYHPDAEVGAYIYAHSFAIYPEDTRNATGHISASTLGNLTLVIRLNTPALPALTPNGALTLQVDCHSKSYNLMQSRGGSIAKALN